MERLARAVKLAAKYREESFDKDGYDKAIEERSKQIVVDPDMVVTKGNARVMAASKLGMTEVPVVVSSTLTIDPGRYYQLSLREAADRAAQEVGYDTRGTEPIYLLLQYTWNDILEWAEQFEKEDEEEEDDEDEPYDPEDPFGDEEGFELTRSDCW